MKKLLFAVLAAFVMSLSFSSCSKSPADQMLDELETIVKKIENASSASDAMAALMETMSLADKYKDVKEEEFTDAQKQRAEELGRRIEAASDKFENMFGDEEEAEDAEEVVEDAEELVEEVVEE